MKPVVTSYGGVDEQLVPDSSGLFINLVPVFGIAASYVVLDERLSPRQWVGAIVVIAAVAASALYVGRRVSAENGAQRVEA